MPARFSDRRDAGRQLASQLTAFTGRPDVVVVALPRGGVPVAFEIAQALGAPLDICVVRKLGAPGQEEYAVGAIASGGVTIVHDETVRALGLNAASLERIRLAEQAELERREARYRHGRRAPALDGKIVILVDDGLATGASMEAAVASVRTHAPAQVIIAVPVASADAVESVGRQADSFVCVAVPDMMGSVGMWYDDFSQVEDTEVERLLAQPAMYASRHAAVPSTSVAMTPSLLLSDTRRAVQAIRQSAQRLVGAPGDFDALLARVGNARVVLIGEATHGTHEFYRIRSEITKRLIREHRFTAVAVEADWPDAHRINAFVRGISDRDRDAAEALGGFRRFPQWMWRNADVLDFVGWLRQHNEQVATSSASVGFYGLDLYSLHASMAAVIEYLDAVDPDAAQRARERYACFDHFGDDPQVYGRATTLGIAESCERDAVQQLLELQRLALDGLPAHGTRDDAARFVAEQNARVVRNAERYYRAMFDRRAISWNLRDRHMMETLSALDRFLAQRGDAPGGAPKLVVWAHNSHVGDASATAMADGGEINIGQLARATYGADAALVGFSTYDGTVTAADEWDGAASRMVVRPALPESVEWLMHETGYAAMHVDLHGELQEVLRTPRLARAIGVIYRPRTERQSHYYNVSLARQFDAVLHYDRTRAVEPLERHGDPVTGELPETYPSTL